MRCCWDTAKLAAVMHDDATKRERVSFLACYFCRNNSCVQALSRTIRRSVMAPNGIFLLKIIKELFRSLPLLLFILPCFDPGHGILASHPCTVCSICSNAPSVPRTGSLSGEQYSNLYSHPFHLSHSRYLQAQ